MRAAVLPERLTAILLSIPLLVLILISISYWTSYQKEEKQHPDKQHISYQKFFLGLMAIGYFGMWLFCAGTVFFLWQGMYYEKLYSMAYRLQRALLIQMIGLTIYYTGCLFFAWVIHSAGKQLRPSTSGINASHRLVQDGPLGIVRHPYYTSYVLIQIGLALTMTTPWPLVLTLCTLIGMGPTAKAEEEELAALFGEEYERYQERVGRFLPKIF